MVVDCQSEYGEDTPNWTKTCCFNVAGYPWRLVHNFKKLYEVMKQLSQTKRTHVRHSFENPLNFDTSLFEVYFSLSFSFPYLL